MFNKKIALYAFVFIISAWVIICYNPFLLWFQNDDFLHLFLSQNGMVFQTNAFRPLCDVHRIIEYNLWGKNPVGYHATNIVLHFICAIIFFYFAKKVAPTSYSAANTKTFALVAGALFLIMPSHSESTFWILGDTAILGAIFPLVSLVFFLRKNRSRVDTAISLLAYVLSLLTYESGWVTPAIAFILQWQKGEGYLNFRKNIGYFIAQGIIFLSYIYAKSHVNTSFIGNYEGANFLHFNLLLLTRNFVVMCFMCFATSTDSQIFLFAGFIVLFVTVCTILIYNRRNFPFKLWLCFFISLLPYLSLGVDTHGSEGGRFMYLPSIFVVLIIMQALYFLKNNSTRYVLLGFATALFAIKLYSNAVNYRFAGNIVKQTVQQLAQVPNGSKLIVEGLPASQHGAVILRRGLDEALKFYLPEKKISVQVLNWRERLNPLQMPYNIIVLPAAANAMPIKYVYTDAALVVYQ